MIDPLTLLDEAIDSMASAISSRCSHSRLPAGTPPGTLKPLKTIAVPVVPVVPGANEQVPENDARSCAIFHLYGFPPKKIARVSTVQKLTGTTGTV